MGIKLHVFRALFKKDFKNCFMNRNVSLMLALPILFVLLYKFILNGGADESFSAYYTLLMCSVLTLSVIPLNILAMLISEEKEKHTLETLLYCPMSVKQIFRSKVAASFILSMTVSLISFLAMILVLEFETFFLMGNLLLPSVNWLIILLIVSPAVSLIAVTLIVRVSAKAQSVEESQQSAVFLIIPLILLIAGQFTGVLLLNKWILLGIGAVCALLAWLLLKKCMGRFTYEMLLK